MKQNKKGRHWPYTIIGLIVFMIIACVVTVIQSLDFPVEDDYSYFDRYQNVENNFNEIQKSEENFLKIFEPVVLNTDTIKLKNSTKVAYVVKDSLTIELKKLDINANLNDVKIKAMIVHPHTAKKDSIVKCVLENGKISIPTSNLGDGRWQLMIEYSYGKNSLFSRIEMFKI